MSSAFPTADHLESFFDGHIPAERLKAAYAADALFPTGPLAAGKPRIASPRALRAAMAALMVERSAAAGACTEEDLGAAGFTRAEIATHLDAARAMAASAVADRRISARGR